MTLTTVAASTALASALALYTNSKLGVTADIQSIRGRKAFGQNLAAHIASLGSHPSIYRLLEVADPNADALWFEGRSWTYRAMQIEVDVLALGLRDLGVKAGDFVAVFMTNSPEMVFTFLALTKLNAVPALINSALRDETLLHSIRLPSASLTLCTPDLAPFAASAAKALSGTIKTVSLNLGSFRTANPITEDVIPFPFPKPDSVDDIVEAPRSLGSVAALIYTSGTTGKPKACSIKAGMIMVVTCRSVEDSSTPSKYFPLRTYSCMPLFHGTTFFTGLCYSVGNSSCFVLSRKFSARNFWAEVVASRATRMLYVGELCRFLVSTPEGPYDRTHDIKVAVGNGLQKDVWLTFQKRFGVPEIREFYRSTEGLVKYDNRHFGGETGAGRVAFQGPLLRRLEKDQFLVKFDYETEMPYRDPATGFCTLASIDEPGEAIARITNPATYTNYHENPAATEAKILRDVFAKGDAFQRCGDLLMQERSGWVRFVDRIGDTFRWKGENVSAGEIRAYICELPEVQDAVLVGKQLKGYDGQAGAAAISLGEPSAEAEAKFMQSLCGRLKQKGIPSYAFPRLVALTDEIQVGDTFKHAKQFVKALQWGTPGSKMYWLDGSKYVPLEAESWKSIERGLARL